MSNRFGVFGVCALTSVAVLGSCSTAEKRAEKDVKAKERLERYGLVAEFTPSIDRLTRFGAVGGPNMLQVLELDRPIPADGSYTFWGGCYSWVAPQKGEQGWRDESGNVKDWPPDPAMDIGPAELSGVSTNSMTVTGPKQRSGLREEKTFRIIDSRTMEVAYTLRNMSDKTVTAGQWINCACEAFKGRNAQPGGDKLAFRIPTGSGDSVLRGTMSDNAVQLFQSVSEAKTPNGWVVLDLAKARWNEGIKVYIDSGDRPAEIAVWHAGYWLHRSLARGGTDSNARLASFGEGPVACYINPGLEIVEAELYAPIIDIAPGGTSKAVEIWTLIRAADGAASALPQ